MLQHPTYEYVGILTEGVLLDELLDQINDLGQEGFHIVYRHDNGNVLLQREVVQCPEPSAAETIERLWKKMLLYTILATAIITMILAWEVYILR